MLPKLECMDVYLLGAGFSKAMHSSMPVMSELGPAVLEQLSLSPEELAPFRGDVEMWLSYLSDRQPWDNEDVGLTNRALFVRASGAVRDVVEAASPASWDDLSSKSQDLLFRMAHHWAEQKTAVLTFNYDLIVETALKQEMNHYREQDLYALPLTSRRDTAGMVVADESADENRPTLYKLHGSTNWLYSGTTYPYAPIVLRERSRDPHLYDDLQPVVVPPTSSKSPFYGNTALRAQWHNAFQQLKTADRLIIMGYSMPTTDLQICSLLGLAMKDSTQIVVVDHSAQAAEHIQKLFPHHDVDSRYAGPGAIDRFIDESCDYVAHWRRDGFPDGQQQLTVNGQSRTRPWTHDVNGADPTQEAVIDLGRYWPSAGNHWRTENKGDAGARLYVSRADYQNCTDPWG